MNKLAPGLEPWTGFWECDDGIRRRCVGLLGAYVVFKDNNNRMGPRQEHVAALAMISRRNSEIARTFGTSETGAARSLHLVFEKLHVPNRNALLASALRRGIVQCTEGFEAPLPDFTSEEVKAGELLAEGAERPEIARILDCTPAAVSKITKTACCKIGLPEDQTLFANVMALGGFVSGLPAYSADHTNLEPPQTIEEELSPEAALDLAWYLQKHPGGHPDIILEWPFVKAPIGT